MSKRETAWMLKGTDVPLGRLQSKVERALRRHTYNLPRVQRRWKGAAEPVHEPMHRSAHTFWANVVAPTVAASSPTWLVTSDTGASGDGLDGSCHRISRRRRCRPVL